MTDLRTPDDRIWEILEHQGRTMKWLARRVGYSISYVKQIKYGQLAAPGRPLGSVFHAGFYASAQRPAEAPNSRRMCSSCRRAQGIGG